MLECAGNPLLEDILDDEEKDDLEIYPEPPDLKRVHELRARLRRDKAETDSTGTGPDSRLNRKVGKTAKDIGTYTLIPSLMVAGPVVGYFLGRLVEKYVSIEPWGAVTGMLVGVGAGFREVFLILKRKSDNE